MKNSKHVYHQYTIRSKKRDDLVKALRKNGIGTGIYYPKCLHRYKPLEKFYKNNLTNAEKAAKEVLSLPIHPLVNKEDLDIIIDVIKKTDLS